MVRLSLLVSLATVLSILENQLPIPRPIWLKLGLANIITIVALVMYGTRAAVTVSCMRALLAGIFGGTLPMLALSFPAAFTSSLSMGTVYRVFGQRFSMVGLSVSGAVVHNMTQLLMVYLLDRLWLLLFGYPVFGLSSSVILFFASLLVLAAVAAGLVTGLIAGHLIRLVVPE